MSNEGINWYELCTIHTLLYFGKTGLIVEPARNGSEAVKLYTEDPHSYNMILMDIEMPVMNGFNATRAIRSSGRARPGISQSSLSVPGCW
ncbi:MAG: response regulator [Treponema sp.]|nr:response regulator [Treponema sp.]